MIKQTLIKYVHLLMRILQLVVFKQVKSSLHLHQSHPIGIHSRPIRDPNKKFANLRKNFSIINHVRFIHFSLVQNPSIASLALSLVEESELETDDFFWSKPSDDLPQKHSSPTIYPILPKLTSPIAEQKTLTPSTPIANIIANTNPSSIGTVRAKAHNFVSRNILIPETCCVVCRHE